MIKVSVIIPVYNSDKYLPRCLDSVCNQTLTDIEIICIDDFSSDKSLEIIKEYKKNYSNLIFVQQEQNQGASIARNAGLSLAQGEYLAFVDSDDEIDLDFYEKLYAKAKEENSDIVRGRAIEINYYGNKNFVPQIEQSNKLFFLTYWLIAIYKRSLIVQNNISFSTSHCLGEDLLFLNQALMAAKDLKLVDSVYYHYHRRPDSSDSEMLSEIKIQSALDVYEAIIDNINANILASDAIYNFLFHHFIMSCFYISLRNKNLQPKQACSKAIISIFAKCKNQEKLEIYFASTTPHLFILLKSGDKNGVEEILVKCKSRVQLVASGLRARMKK